MSEIQYKPSYNSSWAVLVGVNEYADPQISNLRGPVLDAEDLRKMLISVYNFPEDHTFLLTDHRATKARILETLEWLTGNELDPDDRVLVFFSGHGMVREGRDRDHTYYLLPTDAEMGSWNSFIAQESFLITCRHTPAKHILYVIDACFSGSFVAGVKQVAPGLEEMLTHPVRQAIGASLPDQFAFDAPTGRNSLFTEHLLRGLKGEAAGQDGVLTLSRLAVFVQESVRRVNERQVPIFGRLLGSGPGEFVFHFEGNEELPQEVVKALSSELTKVRVAAICELEALGVSTDPDISYKSRAKLQEIASDQDEDNLVRLAAEVVTELSIPMLDALEKEWVDGPLFNQSDCSIFDRILAAIEYGGYNNFRMNNNAMAVIRRYGLDTFAEVSEGEKRRFAQAVVQSALNGAFKSQDFLMAAQRIPDSWLFAVVRESAKCLIERTRSFSGERETRSAFSPLREWVERRGDLPDCWFYFIQASLSGLLPEFNVYGAAREAMAEIWESIDATVSDEAKQRLRAFGKDPDSITRFADLFRQ